jgi:hypothetical protein
MSNETPGTQSAEDEANRRRMGLLISAHFRGDCDFAASILRKVTERKVSSRTIQAWLITPDKPSSRRCPTWAVKTLEEYVPNHKQELDDARRYRESLSSERWWSAANIRDNKDIELATSEIERDAKRTKKWEDTPIHELPRKLAEMEKRFEDFMYGNNERITAILAALGESNDFDEFKKNVNRRQTERWGIYYAVREAREAIEKKTGPFSNDEGLDSD